MVAHALITKLFLVYSTPRVLLSDNGLEFKNSLLKEICSQYHVTQAFITAYHAASNGLPERTNRKILEAIRPVVGELHDTWEDWLPHVATSINNNVCESTGHTPHYILYGHELRLPYDLLDSPQRPVYNVEDYSNAHMKVFADIHQQVRHHLTKSKEAMCVKQHKLSAPVELGPGDNVVVQVPERRSKLSPKFLGPRVITQRLHGNKFEVFDPVTKSTQVVHNDLLKRTKARPEVDSTIGPQPATSENSMASTKPSNPYNLRSKTSNRGCYLQNNLRTMGLWP